MSTSIVIEACLDLASQEASHINLCYSSWFWQCSVLIRGTSLAVQCITASCILARSLGLTQGQWLAHTSNCCELVLLDMPEDLWLEHSALQSAAPKTAALLHGLSLCISQLTRLQHSPKGHVHDAALFAGRPWKCLSYFLAQACQLACCVHQAEKKRAAVGKHHTMHLNGNIR